MWCLTCENYIIQNLNKDTIFQDFPWYFPFKIHFSCGTRIWECMMDLTFWMIPITEVWRQHFRHDLGDHFKTWYFVNLLAFQHFHRKRSIFLFRTLRRWRLSMRNCIRIRHTKNGKRVVWQEKNPSLPACVCRAFVILWYYLRVSPISANINCNLPPKAYPRAVLCCRSTVWTLASFSRRTRTTSTWPWYDDVINAVVLRAANGTLTSAPQSSRVWNKMFNKH